MFFKKAIDFICYTFSTTSNFEIFLYFRFQFFIICFKFMFYDVSVNIFLGFEKFMRTQNLRQS